MEKMCYCIIRAVQQYSDTDEHHQGGMDMAWQFRNDIPIYTQLIAQIQQRIVSGAPAAGGAASLGAGTWPRRQG